MTSRWRLARASCVAAAASVLLLAGRPGIPALARPLDDVRDSGTIRIAVYRDFWPFSDLRDGSPRGVDVDIGRAVAERLGVRAEFMPVTSGETVEDDLRNAVWKGHYLGGGVADVMLHVPVDRRFAMRNKQVAIFGAYARMELVAAADEGVVAARVDPEAVDDGRIGVEIATLGDAYLSSAHAGALRDNVVHYPTTLAAADALRRGEVVLALGTPAEIEAGLGPGRDRFTLEPVAVPGGAWLIGAAVDEHSRDLGYAVADILAEMVASGDIARAFAAHALTYIPPDE